jgi:hypothetical protein
MFKKSYLLYEKKKRRHFGEPQNPENNVILKFRIKYKSRKLSLKQVTKK